MKNNINKNKLSPWFITGLTDAEGCFRIPLRKNSTIKLGYRVGLEFKIELHKKDIGLLEEIKQYFQNKGSISVYGNYARYCIASLKDVNEILLPHFDQYPLRTAKHIDYLLFKKIVLKLRLKQHFTFKGLQKIVHLRATLNWGLTPNLKADFPNTKPVDKPIVAKTIRPFVPFWFAGFVTVFNQLLLQEGDGSFMIGKVISFSVGQHVKDAPLIESFKEVFGCGHFTSFKNAKIYRVSSLFELYTIIIPFFEKYPVKGDKLDSYVAWKMRFWKRIKKKNDLVSDKSTF